MQARFGQGGEWLFIGCGSSYYVALAAAATMKYISPGGEPGRFLPLEFLALSGVGFSATPSIPVLISRSGQTSEALKASDYSGIAAFPVSRFPACAVSHSKAGHPYDPRFPPTNKVR